MFFKAVNCKLVELLPGAAVEFNTISRVGMATLMTDKELLYSYVVQGWKMCILHNSWNHWAAFSIMCLNSIALHTAIFWERDIFIALFFQHPCPEDTVKYVEPSPNQLTKWLLIHAPVHSAWKKAFKIIPEAGKGEGWSSIWHGPFIMHIAFKLFLHLNMSVCVCNP